MRVTPLPRDVIGEALLALWRGTPALKDRFPDTEAGTHGYIAFCAQAVLQRIAK